MVRMKHIPKIRDFENVRDFLNAALIAKKKLNPRYSLRSWARQIGYRNPSLLSQILRGDRKMTVSAVPAFAKSLGMTKAERSLFEILVLKSNAESDLDKVLYEDLLCENVKNAQIPAAVMDKVLFKSDWHNQAVLESLSLKEPKKDVRSLASRFVFSTSSTEVQHALNQLVQNGLVQRNPIGYWERLTTDALPHLCDGSQASRKLSGQMLALAKTAFLTRELKDREMSGSTFPIKAADVEIVKALVAKLYADLSTFLCRSGADEVYRVNVQAFQLTRS